MSLALFVAPKWSFQDDDGGPAASWELYTYEPGTTTEKSAYQDSDGASAHTNPIVLDARGEAEIWLDGEYKFVLKDNFGATKWTSDNVTGYGSGIQTGYLAKSVAGAANVALTASEQSNAVIELTGILTGNINVTVGDDKDGYRWIVKDSTTGAFAVTFKTTSGTGIALSHGVTYGLHSDASNIVKEWGGPTAADKYLYSTAADTWAEGSITSAGRALLDDASAADQRTTLGLGTAAVVNTGATAATIPINSTVFTFLLGYIGGFICSNNASDANNDIDVSAGACIDSTNAAMIVGSAMTKRLDASWAAGTNQGGLDTGSKANSTEYYIHAILKDSDLSGDYLFSASRTAPTMPAGYTKFRNIGWCKTDGSGNIIGFVATETAGGGLHYQWKAPIRDVVLSNTLTTSARLDAISVPTGIKVLAHLFAYIYDGTALGLAIISDPDTTDAAPSETNSPGAEPQWNTSIGRSHRVSVYTNTSRQIRARADLATVDSYIVTTRAFEWSRR